LFRAIKTRTDSCYNINRPLFRSIKTKLDGRQNKNPICFQTAAATNSIPARAAVTSRSPMFIPIPRTRPFRMGQGITRITKNLPHESSPVTVRRRRSEQGI